MKISDGGWMAFFCLWMIVGLATAAEVFKYKILAKKHPYVQLLEHKDVCHHMKEHVYHGHVTVPIPPELTGLWTSHRCEIRPGPEFLLRKYRFTNNTFEIHQYFYNDPNCSDSSYSISAKGVFKLSGPSWLVPGGTEGEYTLTHVSIMPYLGKLAKQFAENINRTCPGIVTSLWAPYDRHEVFNYVEVEKAKEEKSPIVVIDRDCTGGMGISFHELQLLRVEERHHHHMYRKMLFLGDVHTDRLSRSSHRPTSYQEPLYNVEANGCPVCHTIANSNDYYPPELRGHYTKPRQLAGEWFSESCETRPHGVFLTRHIKFYNDSRTWSGSFSHFADASCHDPVFLLFARGTYASGRESRAIPGAFNYDFKVTQLTIKPQHQNIVNNLNSANNNDCGKKGTWLKDLPQDVTVTNGCGLMGIKIPHVEFELVKYEIQHYKHRLFLGQRPSDGSNPTDPEQRPTSFQPPLVRCGDVANAKSVTRKEFLNTIGSAHTLRISVMLSMATPLLILWL